MGVLTVVARWLRRLFPKKPLGRRGEAAAARFLRRRGYKIIARHERLRGGELDLVAVDRDRTLVFVEVKTRESRDAGHPAEAVDLAKTRYPGISYQFNCCVQKGVADEIDDLIGLTEDM